jgi:hypothetical protein
VGDSVDADSKNGKLDDWNQWRNSEVCATGWRNLKKEGYTHYSS